MELANCLLLVPDTPSVTISYLALGPRSRQGRALLGRWKNKIRAFPDPLRKFLGPVRGDTFSKFCHECASLQKALDVLRCIARTGKAELSQDYLVGDFLRTGKDGKIRFEKSLIITVLEGVEARRIRECPICQKIFWAGRIDKKCCSARCRKVWQTRRWRKKYLPSYKLQKYRKAEQTRQSGSRGQN